VAQYAAVARQSIPRFDLYAELGVNPSADEATIEAAYRVAMERKYPDVDPADDRRTVRLRLARTWLTDPERRNRYDASRSRAAVRAAGATKRRSRSSGAIGPLDPGLAAAAEAEAVAEAVEAEAAAEATEAEAAAEAAAEAYSDATTATADTATPDATSESPTIPWPAADLRRREAEAAEAAEAASELELRPRRSRRPAVIGLAIVALALIVAIAFVAFATRPPGGVATASPSPSPAPAATPTAPPSSPSPEPTVLPTTAPPTTEPIDVAALQQAASDTIAALASAAAAGDVTTAQTMLGDSAPDLRASGLRRATFPEVVPTDIVVTQSDTGYLAAAAGDLLTSVDGVAWTFDYGDRPLAAYRSPPGEPVHDLWWVESDGEHHLYIQAGVATVSRSGVTVKLDWTFSPSRPNDAFYFRRAKVVISSVALDDTPTEISAVPLPMVDATTLTPSATFTGVLRAVPSELELEVTITNPRTAGGPDRANETTFKLRVR
jgi:DnaJ-like protein